MDLQAAVNLAKKLMSQHKLVGWKFRFVNSGEVQGSCNHLTKTITLDWPHTELSKEAEVRDTILHEIAHALVGAGHGHDRTWQLKCVEIGARPYQYGKLLRG